MKNTFKCQFKLNETIHESYAYHNLKKNRMSIFAVTQHFEHLLTPDKILKHEFDEYFLKFRYQTSQDTIQSVIQGTFPRREVQPLSILNSVL